MPQLPQGLSSYVLSSYERFFPEDFALGADHTKIGRRSQAAVFL
jgi:hypothetical protein